jgi:hypothetical protein
MKRSWVLLAVLSFLLGVFAAAYWTSSTSSAVAAEPGAEEAAAGFEEATGMQPVTEPASAQPGTPSSLVDRQPQATQPAIGSAETATPAAPASQRAASYTPLTPSWTEPAPAKPAAASYTLETGSTLQVRTTNTLSTKVVEPGETFTASLEEAILDGGWGIAPKGTTVLGKIVSADKGGRVKGRALLAIELTELVLPGGEHVAIRTNAYSAQAESSTKKDAAKVGIGAGVGAIIGAIAGGGSGAAKGAGVGAGAAGGMVLATHGEAAVIPSESVVSFTLAEPVTFSR